MFDFRIAEVKQNNSMRDVLNRYGIKVNNKGFCHCPFHSEKTPSMKIYPDGFYCWGCNKGGDVIDFVQQMEGCDWKTAYHLLGGEDRTLTTEERKRYRQEMETRKREAARKEAIKKQIFGFENAEATLTRQIRTLPDRRDEWDDGFWGELKKLAEWRLKCEIALCNLKENL